MPGLLDPNDDGLISPEERKQIAMQNLFSGLLQGGLQLVAAGENLQPWQRAQMLGQVGQTIGGIPGGIQQGMQSAAQQKLLSQKYAEKKQQDAFLKSEEFQNAVATMSPEYQALAKINPVQAFTNWRQQQVEDKRAQMMADREDARARLQMQIEQMRDARAAAKEANQPTTAQKAVDTAFGKDYADWVAGGGYTDTLKQLGQLDEAKDILTKSGKWASGTLVGAATATGVAPYLLEDATKVKNRVEDVAQRNLRAILGGQFAEREGRELIARAFNPALSAEENIVRITNMANQIRDAARVKQDAADYYEKNGTLRGWTGKLPTLADFDPDRKPPKPPQGATQEQGGNTALIEQARDAIKRGAPRDAVLKRLQERGVDIGGL